MLGGDFTRNYCCIVAAGFWDSTGSIVGHSDSSCGEVSIASQREAFSTLLGRAALSIFQIRALSVKGVGSRYEVGEDAGLDALAMTVGQELLRTAGKKVALKHKRRNE
eukprot:6164960-Amphidinium_carterae.1